MKRLGIAGGTGRMGRALLEILAADARFVLGPVRVRAQHAPFQPLPADAFLVERPEDLFKDVDVVVDFTAPQATAQHLVLAHKTRTPLVIGTTNLDENLLKEIKTCAQEVPLLVAPNTSLGIAVLEVLVESAARALKDFDIAILETHHRHKKDTPSGTAKSLLGVLESALGEKGAQVGMSSIRAGGILGDHEVMFASDEETLSLSHRCLDRRLFARGALQAAAWLAGQKSGLYTMRDVLGLSN